MTQIVVEGRDSRFIEVYLEFLIENKAIPKTTEFKILESNGWTNLPKLDNALIDNSKQKGKNLVIFDADFPDEGGLKKRESEITKIKTSLNLNFELFLFPNHKDDGDYELLLERIVNTTHQRLLDCFHNYETCVGQYNTAAQAIYKLPIRKAKMYSYIDAFPKSKNNNEKFKKGDLFFRNTEYWNLESVHLGALKEFLIKKI